MKLIPITKAHGDRISWINPEYVLSVTEAYIGHKSNGTLGTSILVRSMNPMDTREDIESVLRRLQGGE